MYFAQSLSVSLSLPIISCSWWQNMQYHSLTSRSCANVSLPRPGNPNHLLQPTPFILIVRVVAAPSRSSCIFLSVLLPLSFAVIERVVCNSTSTCNLFHEEGKSHMYASQELHFVQSIEINYSSRSLWSTVKRTHAHLHVHTMTCGQTWAWTAAAAAARSRRSINGAEIGRSGDLVTVKNSIRFSEISKCKFE